MSGALTKDSFTVNPAVQEQPVKLGGTSANTLMEWNGFSPPTVLNAQFTDFDGLAGMLNLVTGYSLQCQLRDCWIGPGSFEPQSPYTIQTFTNNLFERATLYVGTFDWLCHLYFYNNTVRYSTVQFDNDYGANGYRTVRDNLFDNSTLTVAYPNYVAYSNNAYFTSSTSLTPLHTGDLSMFYLLYADGPLGNRYIGSARPTLLNAGSRLASDAGLCNYTIQANQAPDGGMVSIGFHYYDELTFPQPEQQWLMTGQNQPVSIILTTASGCVDISQNNTFTIDQQPDNGSVTLDSSLGAALYTPFSNFEGEDSFTFLVNNGWNSSSATVNIYVVAPPVLTATCLSDRILLNWSIDSVLQGLEGGDPPLQPVTDVYRLNNGVWSLIYTAAYNEFKYVDTAVSQGVNYSYRLQLRNVDYYGHTSGTPYSNVATGSPCSLPAPIRPGFDQNVLAPNDDDGCCYADGFGGTPLTNLLATIGFPVNFFGTTYSNLYVNNNGNVTFGNYLSDYTPVPILEEAENSGLGIIAPFWADVDTRGTGSGVVTYGTGTVNGNAAFGANWIDVGYYSEEYDKLNVFQLVLINRSDRASGDYDVEFNYAQSQWEAGDASGGVDGLWTGIDPYTGYNDGYGSPARAGYASTSGSTFEFNGSGLAGALLDANTVTGLIHNDFNSAVPGRYVFQFHNGIPLGHP